jgi:hypothetical protein
MRKNDSYKKLKEQTSLKFISKNEYLLIIAKNIEEKYKKKSLKTF